MIVLMEIRIANIGIMIGPTGLGRPILTPKVWILLRKLGILWHQY